MPLSSNSSRPVEPCVKVPLMVNVSIDSKPVPGARVPLLTRVPVPTLRLPPPCTNPEFVSEVLLVVKVAPLAMVIVPAFVVNPVPVVRVPAVAFRLPLLVKTFGLIVKVCPTVLAMMLPLLTMVESEL